MAGKKTTNEFEIGVDELCEIEGFDGTKTMLDFYFSQGTVPACCSEGCYVEPDGTCEHGNDSFILEMGMI